MLIQPIFAYRQGRPGFTIFNAVFDWNPDAPEEWWTSAIGSVRPGDRVDSYVSLVEGEDGAPDSYDMYVGTAGGFEVHNNRVVDAGQSGNESWAMFVLEHQPESCEAYPPDQIFTFENIYLEVEFMAVEKPNWVAAQKAPACDSEATVIDARTVAITWDTGAVR